ncbi:telomerase RNA component interacting RNase-like isoform X2 [Haliotis rufescens]|uniref:telomerase RNA component interacting RNase-like isoform X2 n=1 Tax=Haliotis rufescens TaxID=6454 RepID=UPI00201EC582|nr:telomerase RNA component interacting RNase-like isoform X2 [Haliotis rufescens]
MADRRGKRCGSASKERQTVNKFANDGSFLEMFKKKMEEQKALGDKPVTVPDKDDSPTQSSETDSGKLSKTNILSIVGKRRGGSAKVLKTGMVKKPKQEEDEDSGENKDGWSKYLAEVNKYKSQMCTDEDKTRPLVK